MAAPGFGRTFHDFSARRACGQPAPRSRPTILAASARPRGPGACPRDEAHLPAKRPPAQAQARVPRPHGHQGGPGDPQAPPREGPQAPFRVGSRTQCRLTRAAQEPPLALPRLRRRLPAWPLGLDALPDALLVRARRGAGRAAARPRGAEGRRLERRAQPDQAAAARDLARPLGGGGSPRRTTTCSWCGPGLPEAAETRGHDWLVERVDEVLGKAGA